MDRLQELHEKRAALVQQCDELKAKTEWTDEDRASADAKIKEIKSIDTDIERVKAMQDTRRQMATIEPIQPRVQVGDDRTRHDPKYGFRNGRDFFTAVMQAGRGRVDQRLSPLRAAVGSDEQSGIADEYGGFFVPESFAGDLLSVGMEADPTMGRMRDVPMMTPSVKMRARTDKDHSTSVTGGITVTRRPETVEASTSRMQTELITLEATTQMALSFATREILLDSPISFAALIDGAQREEMASELLNEKLNGTGVGEPEGILNNPALISLTRAGGGNNIDGADLIAMRARAWRYSGMIWMANHDCLPNLAAAHLAGTNSDVFLFNPARGEDTPDMLLGRPIFFTEYLPSVAAAGSIVLANWREYLFGEYQGALGESSIHVRFAEHESAFKMWRRNDGRGWWRSALTLKNGSDTLSPFVTLAAV